MPNILAIESSCDETAAAIVINRYVVSSVVASQIDQHSQYGGVVPELASRCHVETMQTVIEEALQGAKLTPSDLDAVAVTSAPGLMGSLLVGLMAAKTFALIHGKPLVGIHHLEGHIFSGVLTDPELDPPCLCLLVSGGHTSLVRVQAWGQYETVGQTRDDAAGEAFDKVARLLGLGYPGGPLIDKLAAQGDPQRFSLPEGRLDTPYDFSFSGVKTAVLRLVEKLKQEVGDQLPLADLAASFQATVTRVLINKTLACALDLGLDQIILTGGVAANRELRQRLISAGETHGLRVIVPPLSLCTDNAAMIAAAAEFHWQQGHTSSLSLGAYSRLPLEAISALYTDQDVSPQA